MRRRQSSARVWRWPIFCEQECRRREPAGAGMNAIPRGPSGRAGECFSTRIGSEGSERNSSLFGATHSARSVCVQARGRLRMAMSICPFFIWRFSAGAEHFGSNRVGSLRRSGWSKDGKPHRIQVVFAVLMAPGACLSAIGCFQTTPRTCAPFTQCCCWWKIRGQTHRLGSGYAGALSEPAWSRWASTGCDHIMAGCARKLAKPLRGIPARPVASRRPRARLTGWVDGRRLIVTWSVCRAARDAAGRETRHRTRNRFVCVRGQAVELDGKAIAEDKRMGGLRGTWTGFADMDADGIVSNTPSSGRSKTASGGSGTAWRPVRSFTGPKDGCVRMWPPCFVAFALARLVCARLRLPSGGRSGFGHGLRHPSRRRQGQKRPAVRWGAAKKATVCPGSALGAARRRWPVLRAQLRGGSSCLAGSRRGLRDWRDARGLPARSGRTRG